MEKLLGKLSPRCPQSQLLPLCRQNQVQELMGLEAKGSGLGPKGLEGGGACPRPAHKGLRH